MTLLEAVLAWLGISSVLIIIGAVVYRIIIAKVEEKYRETHSLPTPTAFSFKEIVPVGTDSGKEFERNVEAHLQNSGLFSAACRPSTIKIPRAKRTTSLGDTEEPHPVCSSFPEANKIGGLKG